jgi:queuine tRNA-ribosyltransferase
LTDSGGYQVFSLAALRAIDDDGVTFRSHLDGDKKRLTPEESMRVQALLGADVAMAFDECPRGGAERHEIELAMRRTTAWAARSLRAPKRERQARFGIVQGSIHDDLRRLHLDDIASMPFDGIALGGYSVGEPIDEMHRSIAAIAPALPDDRPRYLMGVGTPSDLVRAVGAGIDLFDCVLPTRNARNGQALTDHGRVNLRQTRHRDDHAPIEDGCDCPACATFSRAYVRHLFKAKEILGPRLVTQHNLFHYGRLMRRARDAIREHRYDAWARETLARMAAGDEVGPADPRCG